MTAPLLTLAPYNLIASKVAERLAAGRDARDPLAPWAEEVMVASSGVSQSIATAILQQFPNGIAALQLQTIDTLARRIVNGAGEYPRVSTEVERRLAMRTAARSIDDPLTATRGAAAMLERSYRDVRDSGLTLAEFSRRVAGARSLRNRDRTRTVIRVWQQFERLIAKLDAVDPADILARATALIAGSSVLGPRSSVASNRGPRTEDRGLILAGFYDMTGAQLALIRALQAVEKVTAVFVPADDAFAHDFIRQFDVRSTLSPLAGRGQGEGSKSVSEARTREDEIRHVCAEIAALLASGVPARSIGVVARSLDGYDAALFERFCREHGFTTSESVPLPLTAHRFGRAIVLLLRLRERNFPRSDVLEIVRSGLKIATRINAENADLETRQATIAGGRSADLRQRTFRSPVVEDYIGVVSELESLTERIDAKWLTRLADRFRIETDTDLAALDELQKIASLFSRAEVWKRPFEQSSLIDALEQRTINNQQRPGGVWVGDVMRLRGRTFEHLFAIRMQDDVLPQRRVEDPLLVDSDRRILEIREIGDGRAEEQLLFRLICAAGTAVHFSYAASDGFGKPLRRSQFLRHLECGSHAAALREPERRHGRRTPERALQLLVRSGTRGVFDGYVRHDLIRERSAAALQAISPTQLENFGECPQKFFFKQILRVRDLDDPEMEMQINHREKGIVDHKILERFYREAGQDAIAEAKTSLPVIPQPLIESLERIVDEEFDKLDERIPPFNPPMRRIERQATKRLLRQFIANDLADLAALSLMPTLFEQKVGPFTLDVGGTPLRVEGTIDRVDEGGGMYRIVDYKSGKALRHLKLAEKIDRGVRLQLALYAMSAASSFDAAAARVSGTIKPIGGATKPGDFAFELAGKETRLRETLALFVEAIRRGDFPAFPNEDDSDFNACKYCPVNHSCRTRHDAEEKRIVLRSHEPRTLLQEEGA